MTIYRKTGDTASPIEDTLTDEDGSDVDLAGATVTIHIWPRGDNSTLTVDDDTGGNVSIDTPASGEVSYEFQTGDLSSAGVYNYEWEVEFANGDVETWPNDEPGETLVVTEEGA